jgi:hypothetical protein
LTRLARQITKFAPCILGKWIDVNPAQEEYLNPMPVGQLNAEKRYAGHK